jgi:oligosaccharide repeat unit polymerase
MELNIVIINTLFYWIFLFWYIKRYHHFDEIALIIALWAFTSLCSVFFYSTPLYAIQLLKNPVTLLPFIYLFIVFLITLMPLFKYNSSNIQHISCSSPLVLPLIYFLATVSYLPMIEIVMNIITNGLNPFETSYSDAIRDPRWFMSWIGRKSSAFSYVTPFITPALFFYYLGSGKRNILVIIGLIFSFLVLPLSMMTAGSRWAPVNGLLYFIYLFFWLRNIIPPKIKKKVIFIFGSGTALLLFLSAVITLGRFGKNIEQWLLSYSGQSFLVYNQDVWWIRGYTYGEISFEQWLHPYGGGLTPEQIESMTGTWTYGSFWTCFGTLQVDFGPVGLFFICILICIIVFNIAKIKNNTIRLGDLIIVSFLGYMLVTGMFYFTWVNLLGILPITIFLVLLFNMTSNPLALSSRRGKKVTMSKNVSNFLNQKNDSL